MKKIRVYVGYALTHAPYEYKESMHRFKESLRSESWIELLDFWGQPSGTYNVESHAPDIYYRDIHECVGTCHAMIGELSYASIGLGWELGTIVEKHQLPTLMCAKAGVQISHLPIGSVVHNVHAHLYRYRESIDELRETFIAELKAIYEKL